MARKGRPTEHANEDGSAPKPPIDATGIVLSLAPAVEWRDVLTRVLLEQLVACSRIGGFRKQTALACYVKPTVLESWLSEGMRADGSELCRELSVRFQANRNGLGLVLVGVVSAAAQAGDWQAAMKLLEKMEPEWAGTAKDADLCPPDLSNEQKKQMLVDALRNPIGDLREALVTAGLLSADSDLEDPPEPDQSTPSDSKM